MSRYHATRSKPNRTLLFLYHRIRLSKILVGLLAGTVLLFVVSLVIWLYKHSECYSREAGIVWKEGPVHDLPRACPNPSYQPSTAASGSNQNEATASPKICLTTLTDSQSDSFWQRMLRCRDFDQVQKLTWPNQHAYAVKHGYTILDASFLIDTSRPPAWSKIRAVQHLMAKSDDSNSIDKNMRCDWVFWLDADIVIMNSENKLESLLPDDTGIDLIVTYDRRFTANSGAWLIRNTDWSRQFLNEWWNMRTWVRQPGLSLSGDNAAFGHLVKEKLQQQQQQQQNENRHIHMVPRCNFNSFGVFLTESELQTMEKSSTVQQQEWYLSENFYHKGDFIAHASGIDQKAAGVEMLLARAT